VAREAPVPRLPLSKPQPLLLVVPMSARVEGSSGAGDDVPADLMVDTVRGVANGEARDGVPHRVREAPRKRSLMTEPAASRKGPSMTIPPRQIGGRRRTTAIEVAKQAFA
jgi:hypothetical protein